MLKIISYSFICFFALVSCKNAQEKTAEVQEVKPKNILFIAVDDLRPDLNFYGANHIKSPNLDKLASESLVFNRAYCNIPVCGASRASLLSGMRPTRHRFIDHKTELDVDVPGAVSLPKLLKQNGYNTISNGKVYHHNNDDSLAWNSIWFPKGDTRDYQLDKNIKQNTAPNSQGEAFELAVVYDTAYFDGKIAQKGIDDLRQLKESKQPFFLALGFMKPHLPFNAPKKYWDLYNRSNIELP